MFQPIFIRVQVFICLLATTTLSCAQAPKPLPANTAAPVHQSIMEEIKKSVVFLRTDCPAHNAKGESVMESYAGTAFLLALPDSRLGDRSFTYIVTNRHVVQPGIEDARPCRPTGYALIADAKVPTPAGSYVAVSPMSPTQLAWAYSPDPSVDLAIAPISVNQDTADAVFLPSTLLIGDADVALNKVEEGDSVLFTGLFVQMVGQSHSEPIVREGKIAMMPRERFATTLRALGDIYLVDCHVFGGNSGSPMFINLGGQRGNVIGVGVNYRLIGVVSGYVKETLTFEYQTVAAYAGTVEANSGVAVVVPAQKILDLLDGPALKAAREKIIQALPK